MVEFKNNDDDHKSPSSVPLMLTIVGTLADTTWRLFVPTLGGTILGIWADRSFDSRPWFTTIGVLLGSTLAFIFVYLQIKKVQK
jgi:hypothetical protein